MTASINLTESHMLTALRSFILDVLPVGIEVIRGQDNRVPQPLADDFVLMTPSMRARLETNVVTYNDPFPGTPGTRSDKAPTSATVQLDIHGHASAENAQILSTLFRSDVAVDQFKTSGFDVTPLYASDPRQAQFINAEQQVETRWVVDVTMQINPIVSTLQSFADELVIGVPIEGIISVDATYPPGP